MSASAASRNGSDAVLAEVVEEFTNRLQAGESVDVESYIQRHPEHAERIQQLLPALELLADLGRSRSVGSDGVADDVAEDRVSGTLGDFRILREVGKGGMGVVYEAEQLSLRRRVALKVLPFAATMDPRHLQRFRNEAQAAACLHHTNIVPVYFVGVERGVHFYAMQFIDGQPLSELIHQLRQAEKMAPASGEERTTAYQASPGETAAATPTVRAAGASTPPIGEGERGRDYFRRVAELGAQAAQALDHAHQLGIVHRDIKPGNLLLDGRGNLWVTDFGLAHVRHDEANLTVTGQMVGTPRYMSPEQALSQRVPIDHRTDVYSLGATLYELLTLRPAIDGKDREEILKKIAFEEPLAPRRLNRAIPADLETILLKAMAKEPAERYATAQELAEDLHRFLDDRQIRGRRPSWLQRVRRWVRRHQAVVTTATLTLAVALAVGAVLIWRERNETLSALHDSEVHRGRAEERELLARRQLYAAHIAAAQRAWSVAELGVVQRLLEQHIPQPGEEDLRGFEWYYLWGLCRGRKEGLLTLRGHTGAVYSAQFSPDGKLLATAGQDHTVRLWDSATGWARAVLRGHDGEVNWAAFSPDGGTLATAGDDGAVKLWDLNTGQERRQVLKGAAPVVGVAYSPDGKILVAGLRDGWVRWWDLPSGRERPSFRAHKERIDDISFSPDGRTLATGAEDARLWDAATGKLQRLLSNSGPKVNFIRFNHRGDVVAAAAGFAQVQLWDRASGNQFMHLTSASDVVESVAFSPDDRVLATACRAGEVRLWQTRTGKMLDLLTGHAGRVWSVSFAPDGRTLATAGEDGTVRLWDPDARQDRKVLASPPRGGRLALTFSPDGKRLVCGGQEDFQGRLSIWEIPSGRLEASLKSPDIVVGLAMSPDGRVVTTGHYSGLVTVWDLDKGQSRLTFQVAERPNPPYPPLVSDLAYTADGETLLTNGSKQMVRQWEVSTGRLLRDLTPAHERHWDLVYSPARGIVAANTSDGIVLWDLASGSSQSLPWPIPKARSHGAAVFSPDGTILAGWSDFSVCLWDIVSGRALPPLPGHRGAGAAMAFSPDGKTLASLSADGEIKLWSVLTGQEMLSLEDHRGPIRSVVFAPGGRMLATTCHPEGSGVEAHLWLTPDGP